MRINSELRLKWNHSIPTKETACQIINNDDKVVASSIVRAWHKDAFCRKTGRKVSLTRCLQTSGFTKAARQQVWDVVKESGCKII